MNFWDIIDFAYVMFFYILPALIILFVILYLKDYIMTIIRKWRKKYEKASEEWKEDRWALILHIMKIIMFLIMLFPLLGVISYLFEPEAPDMGEYIFQNIMPMVFIVITLWYLLASIYFGIYRYSKEKKEKEEKAIGE